MIYYHCDGSCDLVYDNDDSEQSVDLHTVEWCYQELIIWEGFREGFINRERTIIIINEKTQ